MFCFFAPKVSKSFFVNSVAAMALLLISISSAVASNAVVPMVTEETPTSLQSAPIITVDESPEDHIARRHQRISQDINDFSGWGQYTEFWAFDLETTGFAMWGYQSNSRKPRDRIVELSLIQYINGRATGKSRTWFFNPGQLYDGRYKRPRDIAQDVHGLTPDFLKHQQTFSNSILEIFNFISIENIPLLVGHNVGFDLRFLEAEIAHLDTSHPVAHGYATGQIFAQVRSKDTLESKKRRVHGIHTSPRPKGPGMPYHDFRIWTKKELKARRLASLNAYLAKNAKLEAKAMENIRNATQPDARATRVAERADTREEILAREAAYRAASNIPYEMRDPSPADDSDDEDDDAHTSEPAQKRVRTTGHTSATSTPVTPHSHKLIDCLKDLNINMDIIASESARIKAYNAWKAGTPLDQVLNNTPPRFKFLLNAAIDSGVPAERALTFLLHSAFVDAWLTGWLATQQSHMPTRKSIFYPTARRAAAARIAEEQRLKDEELAELAPLLNLLLESFQELSLTDPTEAELDDDPTHGYQPPESPTVALPVPPAAPNMDQENAGIPESPMRLTPSHTVRAPLTPMTNRPREQGVYIQHPDSPTKFRAAGPLHQGRNIEVMYMKTTDNAEHISPLQVLVRRLF